MKEKRILFLGNDVCHFLPPGQTPGDDIANPIKVRTDILHEHAEHITANLGEFSIVQNGEILRDNESWGVYTSTPPKGADYP